MCLAVYQLLTALLALGLVEQKILKHARLTQYQFRLFHMYRAPFVKILYLTDLAQKLLSLAEIAISACRDVICGRDSYLCVQRCYLWQR